MKIQHFKILNFKGIKEVVVDLSEDIPGQVTTLIGLNESGKTTILEAISNFVTNDTLTSKIVKSQQTTQVSNFNDIVPKHLQAAFNGSIEIEATISLDDADIFALKEHFREKQNCVLDTNNIAKEIIVNRSYTFVDSVYTKLANTWNIEFFLKTKGARRYVNIDGTSKENDEKIKIWRSGVDFLETRIPTIVYFPTFLFQFPSKIYIDKNYLPSDANKEVNDYYYQALQDVLDNQGEALEIEAHILNRINPERLPPSSAIIAKYFSGASKDHISHVLRKAGGEMTRVIFGAWDTILDKKQNGRRVEITLEFENGEIPYLEVSIIDGETKFKVSENSLGFRWFFSFLLFTQFRKKRNSNNGTIFLFDEPAANLHSSAQIRLLNSFKKIATDKTYLIYSTHSHYMINPLWLERAYIVINDSASYELEDVYSLKNVPTEVNAIPYKRYVNDNPTKTTYFQPVLDALDVKISPLSHSKQAIIFEGKFDYQPIVYFKNLLKADWLPDIFPSNGASHMYSLISLFKGWGVKFLIVLDGDKKGREAKRSYINDLIISEREIITLADIDNDFFDCSIEKLYENDVNTAVKEFSRTDKLDKRSYAYYFQYLNYTSDAKKFPKTESNFIKIFNSLRERFD